MDNTRWNAFTYEELAAIYGALCTARPYRYANEHYEAYAEGERLIAELRSRDPLGSDA